MVLTKSRLSNRPARLLRLAVSLTATRSGGGSETAVHREVTERLDAVIEEAERAGRLPGFVAAVADRRATFYVRSATPAPLPPAFRARPDSVVRAASITKLFTAVCALQMVDEGLLGLDEDVTGIWAPEGAGDVLTGFEGDEPVLVRRRSPVTLRQLMGHTSGLAYPLWDRDLLRWRVASAGPKAGAAPERPVPEPPVPERPRRPRPPDGRRGTQSVAPSSPSRERRPGTGRASSGSGG